MDKTSFFGQLPSMQYALGGIVTNLPKGGYMYVLCIAGCSFSVLTFAHPQAAITGAIAAGSDLTGVLIPDGTILYGVKTLNGTGSFIVYFSQPQNRTNP